jgi:hypothetical protein
LLKILLNILRYSGRVYSNERKLDAEDSTSFIYSVHASGPFRQPRLRHAICIARFDGWHSQCSEEEQAKNLKCRLSVQLHSLQFFIIYVSTLLRPTAEKFTPFINDQEEGNIESMEERNGDADNGADNQDIEQQQQQQGQSQGLSSLFTSPPSQAALYTRDNIFRYQTVKQARDADDFDWDNAEPLERLRRQSEILNQAAASLVKEKEAEMETDEIKSAEDDKKMQAPNLLPTPDFDLLLTMDPPRIDWIEEYGYYSCFGETWPVEEKLAGLRDLNMRQFYPDDCQDRRAAMKTLLRTLLKSYLELVDVLLEPPQEYLGTDQGMQSWRFVSQDKAKDINDLSINFMHLLNEMRPLQAKEDLCNLLKRQVSRRREEADLIRLQCQAMRTELAKLRQS